MPGSMVFAYLPRLIKVRITTNIILIKFKLYVKNVQILFIMYSYLTSAVFVFPFISLNVSRDSDTVHRLQTTKLRSIQLYFRAIKLYFIFLLIIPLNLVATMVSKFIYDFNYNGKVRRCPTVVYALHVELVSCHENLSIDFPVSFMSQ